MTTRERKGGLRLAMCMIAGLGLAGCNTMAGVGRDLQAAGRGVSRAAEDTQDFLDDATSDPKAPTTSGATQKRYPPPQGD